MDSTMSLYSRVIELGLNLTIPSLFPTLLTILGFSFPKKRKRKNTDSSNKPSVWEARKFLCFSLCEESGDGEGTGEGVDGYVVELS